MQFEGVWGAFARFELELLLSWGLRWMGVWAYCLAFFLGFHWCALHSGISFAVGVPLLLFLGVGRLGIEAGTGKSRIEHWSF